MCQKVDGFSLSAFEKYNGRNAWSRILFHLCWRHAVLCSFFLVSTQAFFQSVRLSGALHWAAKLLRPFPVTVVESTSKQPDGAELTGTVDLSSPRRSKIFLIGTTNSSQEFRALVKLGTNSTSVGAVLRKGVCPWWF